MSKLTSFLTATLAVLMFISIAPALIVNIKNQYQNLLKPSVNVACVKINCEIKEAESYCKQLTEYFKNKSVKAILLEIDSPGGISGSSQAIFNEIQCLKKDHPKPIVVLSNIACTSGAYYIACTADHIVTTPSAFVGSIGTVIGFFNIHDVLKKYNVTYVDKHSGNYKTTGSPYLPLSTEHEKMLQELNESTYNQFITDVASCRKLSLKDADKWANGRTFTGEQALKLGLIDAIGSKYNAIKKIKELALIKEEENINWLQEKEPNAFAKFLANNTESKLTASAVVDALFAKLESSFISRN